MILHISVDVDTAAAAADAAKGSVAASAKAGEESVRPRRIVHLYHENVYMST